jgi:protein arginine N-methyltransferase 5
MRYDRAHRWCGRLQERKATQWGDSVKLVFSDMRSFHPNEQADIIVSELLGSFGDNELSPECLDGVMRTLSPVGISIPCSYTSYLAPISSNKLHSQISNSTDPKYPEQPYVVMFQAAHVLSETGGREQFAKYAECWGFDHPRMDVVVDETGTCLSLQQIVRAH